MQSRLIEFNTLFETSAQPSPAAPSETGDILTGSLLRAKQAVTLADGDLYKAVAFTTALTSANYGVFARVKNTADGNVIGQTHYEAKSVVQATTGFTVRFSSAIVGSNETLDWFVILNFDPSA